METEGLLRGSFAGEGLALTGDGVLGKRGDGKVGEGTDGVGAAASGVGALAEGVRASGVGALASGAGALVEGTEPGPVGGGIGP